MMNVLRVMSKSESHSHNIADRVRLAILRCSEKMMKMYALTGEFSIKRKYLYKTQNFITSVLARHHAGFQNDESYEALITSPVFFGGAAWMR